VTKRYSKTTQITILCYAKKYCSLLQNVQDIEQLSGYTKGHAVKSLIVLSKFLGRYEQFKNALKQNSIKIETRDNGLNSFLRILNAQNSDVIKWLNDIEQHLRPNEQLFTKFLSVTGMRVGEAIASFNLIIDLHSNGILNQYYDEELSVLQHFKYQHLFIRKTKSAYISFIEKPLVQQIARNQPITYSAIKRNLQRKGITKLRFNELRDYFGTFILRQGILREEQDLLCGRIPPSIFIRHYWSPSFKELKDRVLSALTQLEQTLN
jgi:intergrase/recombinase